MIISVNPPLPPDIAKVKSQKSKVKSRGGFTHILVDIE
ncbi:hypothetical protein NSP_17600 [Nodularia spumigena CCY9414]|nr:hypothetical protein NSP_17600 [Nodularia spumigena CCY9414]